MYKIIIKQPLIAFSVFFLGIVSLMLSGQALSLSMRHPGPGGLYMFLIFIIPGITFTMYPFLCLLEHSCKGDSADE